MIRCSLKQPFCLALGQPVLSLTSLPVNYMHHSSWQSIFRIHSAIEEMRLEEHLGDFCFNDDQIWSLQTLRVHWLLTMVALLKSSFLFNLHNIQWHFLNMKSICLQLDTQLYLTLIYITALIKNTTAFLLRTLISWMHFEVYKQPTRLNALNSTGIIKHCCLTLNYWHMQMQVY